MSSLSALQCDWSHVSKYKDVNQLAVMAWPTINIYAGRLVHLRKGARPYIFMFCVALYLVYPFSAIFAGPKRGRPTPGFSIFTCSDRASEQASLVRLLRSNFGPYTFIKGQRDKGTTQEQRNKWTNEQRNKGTRNKGTKEQRNKGTKELGNIGT